MHNEKKMLHRDMKSLNVLVGLNWECLLTDFGPSSRVPVSAAPALNAIGQGLVTLSRRSEELRAA